MSDRHEPNLRSLLTEAGTSLGAARSLPEVIEALRTTARNAIGAEGIAIVLRDGGHCFYVAEDAVAPLWSGRRFPVDSCVSGWAMQHRQTVVIPDIRIDARVPQDAYRATFVRSLIMAPIGHPEPIAALGAYWADPSGYDSDAVETLQLLAQLAATAIENARLIHAMEESERLRTLMLDAGRMGTWAFDAETERLETSDACRRNFGRDPGLPFAYADFLSAIHPDDRGRVQAAIQQSLASGSDYDVEYRIATPAGEQRWIETRGRPALLLDGGADGLIGVAIDTTARKQAEEALKSSAATLEHLVEERTRELIRTQEALKQAQKLEAMGQLTGGVAHDFNNLLTPIVGSLDMLHRRQIGGEREQRLISGALQSADKARTLVQRLLAFARRQPLKPEAVDMSALIIGMAELIGTTLGPLVDVELKLAEDLPLATADPHQIEMAVLNFAANARDAMPTGGRLTLSTERGTATNATRVGLTARDYVIVRVADTGTGMDDATRDRAIEPFFSTKGIGQGTGLGLSMAHGLALQLGGAMTIDSAVGVGTVVEFWLPASASLARLMPAAPVATPAVAGVALLVDDEDLVRASTADMLIDLGFEVIEARSGAEALSLMASDQRFDIVISDHVMPNMTGVALAREVGRRHPGMPLLIVSGYSDTAGLAAGLPRLEKPFRQADLATALAGLLSAPAGLTDPPPLKLRMAK